VAEQIGLVVAAAELGPADVDVAASQLRMITDLLTQLEGLR
jgi:hypothetical protein